MSRRGKLAAVIAGVSLLAVTVYVYAAANRDTADDPIAACLEDAGQGPSLENLDQRRLQDATFDNAFRACGAAIGYKVLPPGEETRQINQRVQVFLTCLRNAGWDIPEPAPGKQGILDIAAYDRNVSDHRFPEFQTDRRRCLEVLQTSLGHDHPEHGHDGHDHNK